MFTLLDDGLAYVKQGDTVLNEPGGSSQTAGVASELEDAVTEAAEECPGECIFIVTEWADAPRPGPVAPAVQPYPPAGGSVGALSSPAGVRR